MKYDFRKWIACAAVLAVLLLIPIRSCAEEAAEAGESITTSEEYVPEAGIAPDEASSFDAILQVTRRDEGAPVVPGTYVAYYATVFGDIDALRLVWQVWDEEEQLWITVRDGGEFAVIADEDTAQWLFRAVLLNADGEAQTESRFTLPPFDESGLGIAPVEAGTPDFTIRIGDETIHTGTYVADAGDTVESEEGWETAEEGVEAESTDADGEVEEDTENVSEGTEDASGPVLDSEDSDNSDTETNAMYVSIYSTAGGTVRRGDEILLVSRVEGFEGYDLRYQWECDKGEGFAPVEGATSDTYAFAADEESLKWRWRLSVYYE